MVQPLFKVKTIEEGLQLIRESLVFEEFLKNRHESVKIIQAGNRVLAEDIYSARNIPGFNRSTMDGYAVMAQDTFGASDGLPAYLNLVGEIRMSENPSLIIHPGETARIATGGMLPTGANAVVMLEYTEQVDGVMIEVNRSVAFWENVLKADEDLKKGELILTKGHVLRPQDIGVLAALGEEDLQVFQKPTVGVISTGDEVLPIHSQPNPGQIRDINTYALGAAIEQAGCIPEYIGIIPDDEGALEKVFSESVRDERIDILLISGGSSVGVRDYTLKILDKLTSPGTLVHGLALKPGKPTILALNQKKLIIGLPGHPVSAMMVFENVVKKLIYDYKGENQSPFQQKKINALLEHNLFSDPGREEYIRVRLEKRDNRIWAIPILGKSGTISSLVRADGYITIKLNQEGFYRGQKVTVTIF